MRILSPLRLAVIAAVVFLGLSAAHVGRAQAVSGGVKPVPKATPTPTAVIPAKIDLKNLNVAQLAEITIAAYGIRQRLDQVRKTTFERGTTSYAGPDGKPEQANYQRFVIRGASLGKERIRLDQEFPNARYSLIFSDGAVSGMYNNTVFTPRDDVSKRFENQIVHGIEALLRYQENESKLDLQPREKIMGVDYYVLDLTDKQERKTRFYISAKYFRVMILTYEDGGVRYRRKFYDYNSAQGTLVPFRTVLWADDKQVEESEIGTITFGQKVDEGLFSLS
ncbi:MAG TPA: hypothetical protein VGO43_10940 [Pyrinomonadaceae bacterium]|jgi:hypothetical protein|nr:hypothetical protein [Pyrinomonadaceae bacterium]